jgi:hypothetical protein|tara:strand:- start:1792 stop:1953 length:162 start_codon:yes stop_codon:yes gene_type:complete
MTDHGEELIDVEIKDGDDYDDEDDVVGLPDSLFNQNQDGSNRQNIPNGGNSTN